MDGLLVGVLWVVPLEGIPWMWPPGGVLVEWYHFRGLLEGEPWTEYLGGGHLVGSP
jgi:hypothetical protein